MRILARCSAVLLLVAASLAVVPGPAAHAADGTDWYGSWVYGAPERIDVLAKMRGAQLIGQVNDHEGIREFIGHLRTTSGQRCFRVRVTANLDHLPLASVTMCSSTGSISFVTGNVRGDLTVHLERLLGSTTEATSTLFIPESDVDTELRTVGTGYAWWYVTPTFFRYELRRPGLRMVGQGNDGVGLNRELEGVIAKHSDAYGCVRARTSDDFRPLTLEVAGCGLGPRTVEVPRRAYLGWIRVNACQQTSGTLLTCLPMRIPLPA